MIKKVKNWLRSKTPWLHATASFAQEGEDMILRRLFEGQDKGFYVDVGAHHPWRFSNTYYFYRQGWHGINIDAMPGSMRPFMKARPRDINLEVPIAEAENSASFFCFNDPALNTFDPIKAEQIEQDTPFHLTQTVTLTTQRLETLLQQYVPKNQVIDFMSVDAEGHDMAVLLSNDWQQFVPRVILVEDHVADLNKIASPAHKLLQTKGYVLFASTYNTNIYLHENSGLLD